jgi:histidine triad (HIT) family protein
MYNHAPQNYDCPFCRLIQTRDDEIKNEFILDQNNLVTILFPIRWLPKNIGHVLIVPNEHFENIYDLPLEYGSEVHAAAKKIAIAMKVAYKCEGISTLQNNEPAGNQSIWHYHLHVTPRYNGDNPYNSQPRPYTREERLFKAEKLRKYLQAYS